MKTLEIVLPLAADRSPGWYYDSYLDRYLYWDGSFWYVYAAGLLYPATVWEPSPYPPIVVVAGNSVKITDLPPIVVPHLKLVPQA
jgi:hypothetical protein